MTGKTNGISNVTSYSNVVRSRLPPQDAEIRPPPVTHQQAQLKAHLRGLLRRHPEGMLLTQLRRSCPGLLQPELLDSYASTRELLSSMSDVLYMQGIGVQTRVFAHRHQQSG